MESYGKVRISHFLKMHVLLALMPLTTERRCHIGYNTHCSSMMGVKMLLKKGVSATFLCISRHIREAGHFSLVTRTRVYTLCCFSLENVSWSDWEGASLRLFGTVSVLQKKLIQSIRSQQRYFHWRSGRLLITFRKVQVESHLHYLSNLGRRKSQETCMFKISVT